MIQCTLRCIAGSRYMYLCRLSSLLDLPSALVHSLGQRESPSQTPA